MAAYNKKINPTGDKPVLVFKSCTPAGYLSRSADMAGDTA